MKKITKSSRIYSIGDIHGRSDLLEKLLKKIQEDVKKKPVRNNTIIFLGDYIDLDLLKNYLTCPHDCLLKKFF